MKPLKIFYFQAEIGYHYLRERLRSINFDPRFLPLVRQNLIITPQVRMLLDEKGVEMVRDAILRHFDPRLLDIIAIDPLRNVYDGEGENDNTAMLTFLQDRVERLRFLVNPNLGVILAHHTKKIGKKMLEDDPFQGLSGAGSLRSFYPQKLAVQQPTAPHWLGRGGAFCLNRLAWRTAGRTQCRARRSTQTHIGDKRCPTSCHAGCSSYSR